MIFLFLSLGFSLAIMITFKLIPKHNISITQAITTNYLVAFVFGFFTLRKMPSINYIYENDWFFLSVISGIFLILVFNIFALSTKKAGIAITAVSSKMSVIIPVMLGSLIFLENISALKIVGVALVLISFYFIFKKKEGYNIKSKIIILPILLFIGNGTNDSILKFAQYFYISNNEGYVKYLSVAFLISFIIGFLILFFKVLNKTELLNRKSIITGIFLGIFNWHSTLYFIKGLGEIDVSVFIPIFNAGLVTLASLTGVFIFKEKMSKINAIGIIISIIAITIIAYSNG